MRGRLTTVLKSSRGSAPGLTRLFLLVVAIGICLAAALLAVSVAGAQPPAQPGASAVQQYVEDVPTANGQATPVITKPAAQRLSPAAQSALRRSPPATAGALRTIATSPAYGAPKTGASSAGATLPSSSAEESLGSTANAIGTASDARLLGLLVVLIATSIGAVGLAIRSARA